MELIQLFEFDSLYFCRVLTGVNQQLVFIMSIVIFWQATSKGFIDTAPTKLCYDTQ